MCGLWCSRRSRRTDFCFVACHGRNEASPVCRSEIVMITRADDASNAPFSGYAKPLSQPKSSLLNSRMRHGIAAIALISS